MTSRMPSFWRTNDDESIEQLCAVLYGVCNLSLATLWLHWCQQPLEGFLLYRTWVFLGTKMKLFLFWKWRRVALLCCGGSCYSCRSNKPLHFKYQYNPQKQPHRHWLMFRLIHYRTHWDDFNFSDDSCLNDDDALHSYTLMKLNRHVPCF